MSEKPKPLLKDDALYFTDNGAIYHGKCCGMSARYTGHDISGQEVMEITPKIKESCVRDHGFTPQCERCRIAPIVKDPELAEECCEECGQIQGNCICRVNVPGRATLYCN